MQNQLLLNHHRCSDKEPAAGRTCFSRAWRGLGALSAGAGTSRTAVHCGALHRGQQERSRELARADAAGALQVQRGEDWTAWR